MIPGSDARGQQGPRRVLYAVLQFRIAPAPPLEKQRLPLSPAGGGPAGQLSQGVFFVPVGHGRL